MKTIEKMEWKIWNKLNRRASIKTNQEGQGTTEYAILVGVLAVIAMIAIGLFKGKLQSLWDAISSGINGLL